jgi:hypothetical protein
MNTNIVPKLALFLSVAVSLFLLVTGCKKEENPASPPPVVEHPPATMVTLIVHDNTGTAFVDSCTVRDTTLSRVKAPLTGNLDLQSGKIYSCSFKLYDDSAPAIVDITGDIISEKNAHLFRFRYDSNDTSRVHVTNLDKDDNGLPFGLNFTLIVSAGGASAGNLHVQLEHHDDGNKSGADFDLDLDRDFPITITP